MTGAAGTEAQVAELLDGLMPLTDPLKMTLGDDETVAEFAAWMPECRWCPETRSLVTPSGLDCYREHQGDERLYTLLLAFNDARRAWASAQTAKAREDGDGALAKAAKAYMRHATAANKASGLRAAVGLFCKTRTVASAELNREPTVVGTPKGVVDMDMGALLADTEGYSEDGKRWMVTRSCRGDVDSRYAPGLEYDPRWDEFVSEIMCGDAERADYLQRALGYSMLGSNPEECMFVAYGATTRNGKGTLLNTVAWVLGDYAANMPSDFLTRARRGSQSNHDDALGALEGVRLVTMSEPTKGNKLDEAKVKSLTGGDPVTVARKFCPTTTFEPQFTMWLSCNNLPAVEDTSVFSSGRMRVIPFERHFGPGEQDRSLKARFRTEDGAYTVLRWLLDGYQKWKERGLDEPESIRRATGIWTAAGGDDFQRFADTECVIKATARTKTADFYEAYKVWASENGGDSMTNKEIRNRLKELSIPSKKSTGGYFYFIGIKLKQPSEHPLGRNTKPPLGESDEVENVQEKESEDDKPTIRLGKRSTKEDA